MKSSLRRLRVCVGQLGQCIALFAVSYAVAGCTRTVHWEEEVPLNTGETILVKRSGTYTYRSASGNPLAYGYQPDWVSTTEFVYRGKTYIYTDEAGLILLAISPDGQPTLVADAAEYDWNRKHQYFCVTPYYVQFRPDGLGKWQWPERIDAWLFGLPTNLMFGLPELGATGKKFTPIDRTQHNASVAVVAKELRTIDPTYVSKTCLRRN